MTTNITIDRVGGWDDDYFVVVTTTSVVRFDEGRPIPWRCQLCGRHKEPTCPHELAAFEAASQHFNPFNERK